MKLIAWIVAIIIVTVGFISLAYPTYTHRYRLTIEIKTPEGTKTGSGIIEAARRDNGWFPISPNRYKYLLRGDAVFVDLGAGKHVVALLAHGAFGEISRMPTLAIEAFG